MWTINDLILLKYAGVKIDTADFLEAYRHENTHRDFTSCESCGAGTGYQHLPDCRGETILADPRWYEILRGDSRAG